MEVLGVSVHHWPGQRTGNVLFAWRGIQSAYWTWPHKGRRKITYNLVARITSSRVTTSSRVAEMGAICARTCKPRARKGGGVLFLLVSGWDFQSLYTPGLHSCSWLATLAHTTSCLWSQELIITCLLHSFLPYPIYYLGNVGKCGSLCPAYKYIFYFLIILFSYFWTPLHICIL